MHFLAQVSSSGDTMGLILTVAFVAVIGFLIFWGNRQTKKRRETLMARAQELGWEYSGEEVWQHANAARFQIVYSFSSTSNGVPWAMVYSRKVRRNNAVKVSNTIAGSSNTHQTTDRLDWRSDAVSIPNMVFLKFKQPAFVNQLTSLINIDANSYVEHIFSLGLTEADNYRVQTSIVINLLTKSSPFGKEDYGLKQVSSFEHPIFEAHAVNEGDVPQVINARVLAALENWQQGIEARHGTTSGKSQYVQPMVLFYEGGVFLSYDSEMRNPEDYEAIVELGTALVNSQR